jgi:hypothetical protein
VSLTYGELKETQELIGDLIRSLRIRHAKDGAGIGLVGHQQSSEESSAMMPDVFGRHLHRCDNSAECLSIQKEVTRLENLAYRYQILMDAGQKWILTADGLVALPRDTMDIEPAKWLGFMALILISKNSYGARLKKRDSMKVFILLKNEKKKELSGKNQDPGFREKKTFGRPNHFGIC